MRRNLIRRILLGGICLQEYPLSPAVHRRKKDRYEKDHRHSGAFDCRLHLGYGAFLPSPVLSFKCYRGDGVSCAQLGRDKLSRGDYDGAKLAFAKVCEAGEKDSCFDLGALYDGEGNATQAGVFYDAACDKNVAVACHKLGNLYQRGRLSRDFVAAAQRYAKACDLGYAKSCHNAGVVYFTGGFGLAVDPAKATSFFERGCDGGMRDSCYNAGIAYDKGLGAPKNRHKAEKLYAKSCELGFGDACNNLGYLYLSDGDLRGFSKGLGCVKKGCDAGNKRSCEFYEFIKEKILKKQGGR